MEADNGKQVFFRSDFWDRLGGKVCYDWSMVFKATICINQS